ncbi:MAG: GAF domain-containing protein [Bacteroidota bacterium]|nr:GAF domain-containing protein [Bacteroidota bacterium]
MNKQEKHRKGIVEENEALKRTVEELSILSDFASAVAGTSDLNKILKTIVLRALTAFHAAQGVISLVNENKDDPSKTLVRIAVTSTEKKEFHFNEGLLGWMLLNKKPLLLNDPHNNPHFKRIRWDEPVKSLLCAPMMIKGNLTGVLTIYNSEERIFTADDQRLLAIIAINMAQVVENARLDEERRMMQVHIARDLHDDVASSLSSIAFYAESLKRQLGHIPREVLETIEKMSSLSLEAVDAMGDIVWSIAPEHDSLTELLYRLKNLAIDLCNAKEIRHHIQIPDRSTERELTVDVRRNIFLIFKEALNNVLNHSQAQTVRISITINNGLFEMTIADDGIGFFVESGLIGNRIVGGHGLRNMKKRANEIQAKFTIDSDIEKGTTVKLTKKMT